MSNEKYIGDVRLKGTNPDEDFYYPNNHEAIISREQFQAVQQEKARRSNVVRQDSEVKPAEKMYKLRNSFQ
ncbi:recombinase family protein [Aerococcaceae bacterium DSM 111020]|nr:recombinase family protein [Aerococcaceae bacterium DSM 111020]